MSMDLLIDFRHVHAFQEACKAGDTAAGCKYTDLLRMAGQRYQDLEAMARDVNVSRYDFEAFMADCDAAEARS